MKFEVDTAAVGSAYSKLTEMMREIDEKRSEMYWELELLDGMWTGKAHDNFAAQYHIDNELMLQLLNELNALVEHVEFSRKTYDDCEAKAKQEIESIAI